MKSFHLRLKIKSRQLFHFIFYPDIFLRFSKPETLIYFFTFCSKRFFFLQQRDNQIKISRKCFYLCQRKKKYLKCFCTSFVISEAIENEMPQVLRKNVHQRRELGYFPRECLSMFIRVHVVNDFASVFSFVIISRICRIRVYRRLKTLEQEIGTWSVRSNYYDMARFFILWKQLEQSKLGSIIAKIWYEKI